MSWKKTPAPEFPGNLLRAASCSGCSGFRKGKIPALGAVCRSTLNDCAMRVSSAKNTLPLGAYERPHNNWSSGKLAGCRGKIVGKKSDFFSPFYSFCSTIEPGSSVLAAPHELRDVLCRDLPVHSASEQNNRRFAPF